MIILDENFPDSQRDALRRLRLRPRQVGVDFLAKGYRDYEIVDHMQRGGRTTFFSFDQDYYRRDWRHNRYCLVLLDIPRHNLSADFVRQLLRLPLFDTEAKRLGHVIRITPSGLTF
jgi:hypothetical protein